VVIGRPEFWDPPALRHNAYQIALCTRKPRLSCHPNLCCPGHRSVGFTCFRRSILSRVVLIEPWLAEYACPRILVGLKSRVSRECQLSETEHIDRKNILITGATSGIGLAAARELHRSGARLLLVARNGRKLADVARTFGDNRVKTFCADLSLVKEVDRIADEILSQTNRLDVLLNNAGGMATRRSLTAEGLERTFATNHLGYFHLTNRLVPLLIASAPSRIICVASDAHQWATSIDFENLQGEKRFSGMRSYAESKLFNILFTRELARRLSGTGVTVNALHPGVVRTAIFPGGALGRFVIGLFSISAEQGADTPVFLSTSSEVEGVTGKYFCKRKQTNPSDLALDDDLARKTWEESDRLISNLLGGGHDPNAA
jgi:NAD(P)-dependent dehydrogenase (short-subunit alcohol dehydrogenase family)